METQNANDSLDSKNTTLLAIFKILEKDKNLCNLSRYIEYGSFKKTENSNYGNITAWQAKDCVLNPKCKNNISSVIKIVNEINGTFFDSLKIFCIDKRESINSSLQSLFNVNDGRRTGINRMNELSHNLQNLMVNIDCTYKITGTSLTAFDFMSKNTDYTNSEYCWFKDVACNITKLIFVGDKSYLIGVIDSLHNCFISLKILENIYKKDKTENKEVFTSIVVKLFNVLQRCCIFILNRNIIQYYNDMLISPIINDIYANKKNFSIDEKISINSLNDLKFYDNEDKDTFFKEKIISLLNTQIYNCINKNGYISNINIAEIINGIKSCYAKRVEQRVKDAFNTGLKLFKIINECGWQVCDLNNKETITNKSVVLYYQDDHIYIYKDLNLYPVIAYISRDGYKKMRMIKDAYKSQLSRKIFVRRLYLDVTTGTLYCDGLHPNVSRGNVCMGDLKGKVVFNGSTEDQIRDLLKACEELLTVINFTSAYSSEYEFYFSDNEYSQDYYGAVDYNKQFIEESETKDLESFDDSDIEEISENDAETSSSTGDLEIANEDDYEDEES